MKEQYNGEMINRAEYARKKWADHLSAVKSSIPVVTEQTLNALAICLENTAEYLGRMDEATKSVNVGSFINHGFELITAILPSLISNEIMSLQPLTRRKGEIFYMDFVYGTTKGNVTSQDTLYGWKQVGEANKSYAYEGVDNEIVGPGNGTLQIFTKTLTVKPLVTGTVVLHAYKESDGSLMTVTDDGAGNLVGNIDGAGTNTISYTNGALAVKFSAAVKNLTNVVVSYKLNYENNPENIPEVDLKISSTLVTAENFKLRAKYSLDGAYDLQQAFGRSAEDDLKAALAAEIRQEIDCRNMQLLLDSAAFNGYTFSKGTPVNYAYAEYKWDFIDKFLIPMSNKIFDATKRAVGNFVIVGSDAANIIEGLAPRFKSSGQTQPGPYFLGTIDGRWKVYKNPYFATNQVLVGYRGNSWLEAGAVYSVYLPLLTTRTVMLDDFIGRFGMVTSSKTHMVNDNFYVKGTIIA